MKTKRDRKPVIRDSDPPHLVEAFAMRGSMLIACHKARQVLREDNRRMAVELEKSEREIERLTAEVEALRNPTRGRKSA